MTAARSRFWRLGATFVALALAVHLLAVWAAPRLIMQMFFHRSAAQGLAAANQAVFAPAVTAASRSIVMPSPDMLYSVCKLDLSQGPVRITANPALASYWSIALYGDNSDNFFVRNDRQAAGQPVDLWLVYEGATAQDRVAPTGSTLVRSPSLQGLLLMRVLTGDYAAEKAVLEPARRTLSCSTQP